MYLAKVEMIKCLKMALLSFSFEDDILFFSEIAMVLINLYQDFVSSNVVSKYVFD